MKQAIKRFIKQMLPAETSIVNRILVSSFVASNRLDVQNPEIKRFIIGIDNHSNELELLSNYEQLDIEDLIELFEFVISPVEKEVNGAIYTPLYIREYIVKETLQKYTNKELINIKIGDLSCGCGGFFVTAALYIHQKTGVSINKIISNFYGVDIASYSIERTRIILNLLCALNGEEISSHVNLYQANSCKFFKNF